MGHKRGTQRRLPFIYFRMLFLGYLDSNSRGTWVFANLSAWVFCPFLESPRSYCPSQNHRWPFSVIPNGIFYQSKNSRHLFPVYITKVRGDNSLKAVKGLPNRYSLPKRSVRSSRQHQPSQIRKCKIRDSNRILIICFFFRLFSSETKKIF